MSSSNEKIFSPFLRSWFVGAGNDRLPQYVSLFPYVQSRSEKHGRRLQNRHLFTLVELISVITIILILTSTLLPAVEYARVKAGGTACRSNLRQLAMTWSSYSVDYDGMCMPADLGGRIDSWANYAAIASGSPEILSCPLSHKEACFDPYGGEGKYGALEHASYTMNAIKHEGPAWSGGFLPEPVTLAGWSNGTSKSIPRVKAVTPAKKMVLFDARKNISSQDARGVVRFKETDHGTFSGDRDVSIHHRGGFNTVFGDGHVGWFIESDKDHWPATKW